MNGRSWLAELSVSLRFISLLFGLALVILSLFLLVTIFETRGTAQASQFLLFYELVLSLSILAGGATLVHNVARNIRLRVPAGRFLKLPRVSRDSGYRYGFSAAVAIGLGATLGSPLFVLVPLNVLQSGIVSIVSILIAGSLSLVVAQLYGRMYKEWHAKGQDCTGGPSFTRNACGRVSLRYFIARFGMWIGNTALAAYSIIIFAGYSLTGFADTLQAVGGPGIPGNLVSAILILLLVVWFIINAFFERTYAKKMAAMQIGLTMILSGILLFESGLLFLKPRASYVSLLTVSSPDPLSLIFAIVSNTAFLFLLFFGFQEIQALSSDFASKSSVPGLGFLSRFKDIERVRFAKYAMLGTVIIATLINGLFAVAVYLASPDPARLAASSVPAIYVAQSLLGPWSALLMGIGFIIASLTTLVPAFLASSRHLQALSSDGFFPRAVGKASWLFSLVFIVILSLFNADFLVRITDFGVLVSLAFISFAALWSKKNTLWPLKWADLSPMVAGVACFFVAGALYLVDPNVVLFGVILVMIGYLIFDVFELGSYGSQLFLAVLYLVLLGVTGIFIRSGAFTESPGASLRMIQNTLEASLAIFAINLLLGAKLGRWLKRRTVLVASALKSKGSRLAFHLRGLRKNSGMNQVVDQWIRLMSESEKIAAKDPHNFELVKKHLNDRLNAMHDFRKDKN